MTQQEKVCRNAHAKGHWTKGFCALYCSKVKQVKCNFLDDLNIAAANEQTYDPDSPEHERDIPDRVLQLNN